MPRVTSTDRNPDFTVPESRNFGWQLLKRPQSGEGNLSITVQRFEPGGWFEDHQHDLDQYFYVTEGCFEMTIAGQSASYEKGALIHVARNESHAGRNLLNSYSELLVIDYWPSDSESELGLEE